MAKKQQAAQPTRTPMEFGGGEMAERMHAHDWSKTELGPFEAWPRSLLTVASICLASPLPTFIYWGPKLRAVYNDASIRGLGTRHPHAFGKTAAEVFNEPGDVIAPLLEQVVHSRQAAWSADQLLIVNRDGDYEETYVTRSFSPILDEEGGVGGVFVTVTDTTAQVLSARRLQTLKELGMHAANAAGVEQACRLAAEALARNRADVPFATIYLADSTRRTLLLKATMGVEPQTCGIPNQVTLEQGATVRTPWPLAEVVTSGRTVELENITDKFGRLRDGPWPEPPHTAVMSPIGFADGGHAAGVLTMGINPRRALDDDYRMFIQLVCGQIATILENAKAREERQTSAKGKLFSIKESRRRARTEAKVEQLRAEAQVERRKHASLINNAPVILWAVDRDGVYTLSEGNGLTAIGMKPRELVGKSYLEIHQAEPHLVENVKRALRGDAFMQDVCVRQRWFQTQYSPVRDAGGEVTGMVGVSTDITERKKAEEALRESERMTKTLIANLPGVVYRCENRPGWPLTYASPGIAELTGYAAEDFIEKKTVASTDVIHPDDLQWMEKEVQAALVERKTFTLIFRVRHRSGEERWVWDRGQGVYADDGSVLAIEGFANDITELTRTRKELQVSRERFDLVMDSVNVGFWYWDIQSGKRIWSDNVRGHLSVPPGADVTASTFYDRLHPDDYERVRAAIDKTLNEGCPYDIEYRSVDPENGDIKWVHSIGRCFYDPDGKPLHFDGVTLDVTEKRKTEEMLFNARRLDSIGILAGGIAHDFNNILTAILGNVLLAKLCHVADPTVTDALNQAEKASLRARDLTQQLLTFSKGGAPVKKPGSVAEFLRETAAFTLRGSKARLVLNITQGLWPALFDAGQMSQVINNLLMNAMQAMPDGGTVIVAARNKYLAVANIYQLPSGRYLEIKLRDEGIGIAPEHLNRVFDPYFTTKQNGNGLGLATSYSIIKRHDGYIGVTSKPNQGTTFTIYLPACAEGEMLPPPVVAEVLHKGRGRILLMDDEAAVRQVGAALLKQLGYEVALAIDGTHAIAQYKAAMAGQRFDLVILDLTVPASMAGMECLERLREMDPTVKAVISSGYSTDPVMADYASYRFEGIIAKPYNLHELSETLYRILQNKSGVTAAP